VRGREGEDGFIDKIYVATGGRRKPPYEFDNSKNASEDVHGLMSAIGVSLMLMTGDGVNATSNDSASTIKVEAKRIGTDQLISYVYMLPPLATLVALLALVSQSIHEN
jgi:hypothetical protein